MNKSKITRRDFMHWTAGVTGVTLATPSILLKPATWAARAGPVPPPSDRVRFGIIGVGMQGSGLLGTAVSLPGIECVMACDLYDGRHNVAKEIVGNPIPTTQRYKELLDNKEIDCIINATPDHWHRQIVLDCCAAGKDVYCEKPMTHAVKEGFEMIAAAEGNRRIVQVGSQRPSSVIYAKAQELYSQGAIGEVCLVEACMGRNDPGGAWVYPVPPDLSPQNLDWDTWLGTAPKVPFNPYHFQRWRCWQAYGSGVAGDLFVHLLTGIHYVTGITAPPAHALSSGGLYRWKDGRDVPDVHACVFDYPKFQAVVRVTLNTETPEITRFMGTRGMLEILDNELTLTPQDGLDNEPSYMSDTWPKQLRENYLARWREEHPYQHGAHKEIASTRYRVPPGYNETREHLWNFFDAVRTRRPVVEDATFGNNTALACHMANESYFNKAAVTWDAASRAIKA
jgi:predicted dehydrogenase